MENLKLLHSGQQFLEACCEAIHQADDTIKISTFRFENPENKRSKELDHLFLALAVARKRKVKISVLLNIYSDSKRLSQINTKTAVILRGLGINVRRPTGNITNHAKLLISDEKYLILGSHNLTRHSFTNNFEVSLLITEKKILLEATKIYDIALSLAGAV